MDDYQEFVGRTETRTDTADARLIEGLAATLDTATPAGDLPPLWHWMATPSAAGFCRRCITCPVACGPGGGWNLAPPASAWVTR